MRPNGRPSRRRARPYRDSVLLYGTLATVIVLVAGLTGGQVVNALLIAVAFFVGATGWSWWRLRQRLAKDGRQR